MTFQVLAERQAVLSIGANLGDRITGIDRAVALIDAIEGIRVVARSSNWESPAWKPDGQSTEGVPDYVNVVLLVRTSLQPLALLDELHAVEDALGRVRRERYGDRTIDIDIVHIEGVVSADAQLTLPHPRAHERAFVLHPWLEVDPRAELPGHGGVAELAEYADGDVWRLP